MIGSQIGTYQLDQILGQGGMGSVFLANRTTGDFDREVALKLIRSGNFGEEATQRFRQERQILAQLVHPGIARLYDGGTSGDGRPFFTMEYVEGESIIDFLNKKGALLKERLQYFLDICKAISYAHSRLVLHLDIKPSNILVNEEGEAKVLDFGVAESVSEAEKNGTTSGSNRYTLAYGSPEQLRQEGLSTRSDVYSLGVLLYQMLTGQLPFPPKDDSPTAYKEFILSGEVKAPSVLTEFTARDIHSSTLQGDLDAIIMRCLEKEAERRYGSVDALITDVEAYLTDRPISVRANDSWYSLQKFTARNKSWLSAVAAGLLAIIILGIYYTTEVTKERNEALAESRKNEQLLGFVTDIFQEADPRYAQGDTLTVFDLLDQASERIDSTLENEPELYAEMHFAIADIYQGMGAYNKADTLVKAGLSMVNEYPDLQGGDLQSKLFYLESDIYYGLGDYQESRRIAKKGLDIQHRLASTSEQKCLFYQRLGDLAMEETNYPQADSQYQLALACFQGAENPDRENMASMMHALGHLNRELNRLDSAEMFLYQSLRLKEEIYEAPHSEIAYTLNNLASLFFQKVEYDSAIYFARESYVQRRKVFGLGHVETVASIGNMSRIYHQQEEWDSSLVYKYLMNTSLDEIFDGPHPYKISALDQVGRLLLTLDRLEEADSIYDRDITVYQELLKANEGNAYPRYGSVVYQGKGLVFYEKGQYIQALPYMEKAYGLSLEMGKELSHTRASAQYYLGLCQSKLGMGQESEKNLLGAKEYFLTAPVRYEKQLVRLDTLLGR